MTGFDMSGFDDEPPSVVRRDVVLVAGPPRAGSSAVLSRLRERLPGHRFVGAAEVEAHQAPVAVVFVVSAVAPATESDRALARRLTRHTAAVLAVVAKIDDHRHWAAVLGAARDAFPDHVAWVGAAAAPRLGPPRVDELVAAVSEMLADPALATRNRLQAWHSHLAEELSRGRTTAAQRYAGIEALQQLRRDLVREHRRARAQQVISHREQVAQARLTLMAVARARCASMHAELSARAGQAARRDVGEIVGCVPAACAVVLADIDEQISAELADLAAAQTDTMPPPGLELPAPLMQCRQLETRLMTVLGAGFGLGVALALSRLLTGLAPQATAAALVAGLVAGGAVTVWVVRTRALLHDRVVLQRWVQQAAHALRGASEERVAARVLAVDTAVATALARQDVERAARCSEIDAQLRDHRRRAERAEAQEQRAAAALQSRLNTVAGLRSRADATTPPVTRR
ncbi:hypothetical protein [Mycobacterium sp. SMC-4]|uniref:hypothetical protein n=1 Tax=Mycobacterium sp. SMC-4 TaxID=2857059 RepID=UPI0021B4C8FB|nr:hypothetical protein [Mycobacterium sp. SMC-4]UXA18335.1 hypothetical protein KXD98_00950 [Mycobacterium sp. SMC-4]